MHGKGQGQGESRSSERTDSIPWLSPTICAISAWHLPKVMIRKKCVPRLQRAKAKAKATAATAQAQAQAQAQGHGTRHQRPKQRGKDAKTQRGKEAKRERQERRTAPLRVKLGKKQQRFRFFLFLKSCILISFCGAQFVPIRMNLCGSKHKSYSRHSQYLEHSTRLQKNYHFSSAFIIDHTSI